ncbi:MAG: glycine zipper 2TM domain-containing protein, partial [Burkholderiaceae bacterium]
MNPTLSTLTFGALLAAGAAQAATYATVISSTPVTATVAVPQQVCDEGQHLVRPAPTGVGAVIGAIAGGVIGHSIGGGFGQAAATGLGVVAGAAVGDQVEANAAPISSVPVRRCHSVSTYREQVLGYDVMYEYAGQRYSTRMARDPGARLAIDVRPLESGALPAPRYQDSSQTAPAPVPLASAYPPAYRSSDSSLYPDADAPAYAPVYRSAYPPLYVPAYAPIGMSAPPLVLVSPIVGFGFGYSGGYRHHHPR